MIASMGAFAIADTLVKISTSFISPAQTLFFLISGALIIFACMAILQGETLLDARALSPILWVRYLAEIAGMVGMVTALAKVPISVVGAVTQASPILATLGAVLFLNEVVGWRRWCSIIVGFVGVLLIVQPGSNAFNASVLWAILALLAMSIRDLTTRLTPKDMSSSCLATYTMAAATPFTIAWVYSNEQVLFPPEIDWLVITPMVILGALAYHLLITAIRLGDVSVVMPFRYVRIIFLLILGIVVFNEKPGVLVLLGAVLIIGSGSYLMWRERLVTSDEQH